MRRLDEIVRIQWDTWVNGAPESWKRDGFLTSNIPVAITMQYGQNQEVNQSAETAEDGRRIWNMDHDYTHIRQFTFSIATSIRSVLFVCLCGLGDNLRITDTRLSLSGKRGPPRR